MDVTTGALFHLIPPPVCSGICVSQSLVFCIVYCEPLFIFSIFSFGIASFVLILCIASNDLLGIFKLFSSIILTCVYSLLSNISKCREIITIITSIDWLIVVKQQATRTIYHVDRKVTLRNLNCQWKNDIFDRVGRRFLTMCDSPWATAGCFCHMQRACLFPNRTLYSTYRPSCVYDLDSSRTISRFPLWRVGITL